MVTTLSRGVPDYVALRLTPPTRLYRMQALFRAVLPLVETWTRDIPEVVVSRLRQGACLHHSLHASTILVVLVVEKDTGRESSNARGLQLERWPLRIFRCIDLCTGAILCSIKSQCGFIIELSGPC